MSPSSSLHLLIALLYHSYGARNQRARNQAAKKFRIRDSNIFNRVMTRMRKWFKEVL